MTAGERIRRRRNSLGLSLAAVARHVGTDKTEISRLESGQRRLTITWVEKIADALGEHPGDLIWPKDLAA